MPPPLPASPPVPLPPAPPPRSLASRFATDPAGLVAALNRRFDEGRPSNALSEAGVLVRQFDRISGTDLGAPWTSCPRDYWCGVYHSQLPSSLLNSRLRRMYYDTGNDIRGGMIFDGALLDDALLCVYPRARL